MLFLHEKNFKAAAETSNGEFEYKVLDSFFCLFPAFVACRLAGLYPWFID
jgi:hypothetical protein